MYDDEIQEYGFHCMGADVPSDQAFATALLARSISQLAKEVGEIRAVLDERLDALTDRRWP